MMKTPSFVISCYRRHVLAAFSQDGHKATPAMIVANAFTGRILQEAMV
jgi:hypothetical protein